MGLFDAVCALEEAEAVSNLVAIPAELVGDDLRGGLASPFDYGDDCVGLRCQRSGAEALCFDGGPCVVAW